MVSGSALHGPFVGRATGRGLRLPKRQLGDGDRVAEEVLVGSVPEEFPTPVRNIDEGLGEISARTLIVFETNQDFVAFLRRRLTDPRLHVVHGSAAGGWHNRTPFQLTYHRAGHAHAGVLVTLSLVVLLFLEITELGGMVFEHTRAVDVENDDGTRTLTYDLELGLYPY